MTRPDLTHGGYVKKLGKLALEEGGVGVGGGGGAGSSTSKILMNLIQRGNGRGRNISGRGRKASENNKSLTLVASLWPGGINLYQGKGKAIPVHLL